jgi:hypothetical protein
MKAPAYQRERKVLRSLRLSSPFNERGKPEPDELGGRVVSSAP